MVDDRGYCHPVRRGAGAPHDSPGDRHDPPRSPGRLPEWWPGADVAPVPGNDLRGVRAKLGLPVDMSESAVLGVAIEMDLPVRWLAFRASVDRTLLSDLLEPPAVDCGEKCVAIGPGPSTEVGDLGKWSFGTDVVFQPVPRAWASRPFAAIGTGVDWYRFDEELEHENALSRGTTDRWTATAHLGFGMDVRIAGRTIRSEVGFYRSEREHVLGWAHQRIAPPTSGHPVTTSRRQDVVQFTIGLRSPLR